MSGLELARVRDISALFADSLRVYLGHWRTLLLLSAAVVMPVGLAVEGVGMERLAAPYDSSPSLAETAIPAAVSFLVVGPLLSAICIHVLHPVAAGERPRAREALLSGLEAFAAIFFAVLLAGLGITLGLALLILPGVYVAVRWYFVPQAVVIDGARGTGALARSGVLVSGRWWRTFGLVAIANISTIIPGALLIGTFGAIAASADREVWSLAGSLGAETLTAPFLALYSTLLYYDLRTRAESGAS